MKSFFSDTETYIKNIMLEAGEKLKKIYFSQDYGEINRKKNGDIVTGADTAVESFLIGKIKRKFPNSGIISEENGEENKKSEVTFIIDPLDGTKEFIRKINTFSIVTGVMVEDKMQMGFIYKPIFNEFYSGCRNQGSFLNGMPITVSRIQTLAQAYIYTIFPLSSTPDPEAKRAWNLLFSLNRKAQRIRGMGNTNEAFCLIGRGSFEGYVNPIGMAKGMWDVAAASVILQEAGGRITCLDGSPFHVRALHKGILASNGLMHEKLLELFRLSNHL